MNIPLIPRDLRALVQSFVVPHLHAAYDVCMESYHLDEANDTYTFGTQFSRNAWNRLWSAASSDQTFPFTTRGRCVEYALHAGDYVIRIHRVEPNTLLPRNARAAKAYADLTAQLDLFSGPDELPREFVVGIVADPVFGLGQMFLGVMASDGSGRYYWRERVVLDINITAVNDESELVQPEPEVYPVASFPQDEEKTPDNSVVLKQLEDEKTEEP